MPDEVLNVDCLIAGDANVDLLVEGHTALQVGKELLASDLNLVLGGSSSITAFNLARLGARVAFVGVLGTDFFGDYVASKLASAGVNIKAIRKTEEAKTGMTIWHTQNGLRAGITYSGSIALLEASDVSTQLLRCARHLHVGAYFLQERFHSGAAQLFAQARELGLTTSLDCNYDPTERWDSHLREVLAHTDFFFPNEDEALRITGAGNTQQAARELAKLARIVAVKRGAEGVFIVTGSEEIAVSAVPVAVVDTTGAGDSFNAGFLAKFLKGGTLRESGQAGIEAGARCVQMTGGTAAFELELIPSSIR